MLEALYCSICHEAQFVVSRVKRIKYKSMAVSAGGQQRLLPVSFIESQPSSGVVLLPIREDLQIIDHVL